MALLRQIAQLGHPVLRAPAAPVPLPVPEAVRALVADMLETLEDASGAGLAAPQVYEGWSLFLIAPLPDPADPDADPGDPEVVLNPEILEVSREMVRGWEGCLSIPGIRGKVPRHRRLRARYRNLEGVEVEREFGDFAARVFQHEYDHLQGVVFLDRLESTRDIISEKEYQKLCERG